MVFGVLLLIVFFYYKIVEKKNGDKDVKLSFDVKEKFKVFCKLGGFV